MTMTNVSRLNHPVISGTVFGNRGLGPEFCKVVLHSINMILKGHWRYTCIYLPSVMYEGIVKTVAPECVMTLSSREFTSHDEVAAVLDPLVVLLQAIRELSMWNPSTLCIVSKRNIHLRAPYLLLPSTCLPMNN